MTKPDFQAMSRKELLSYFLEHRDEQEAFYALMDKLYTTPVREKFPAPQSIDELANFPELLERRRQQQMEDL